MNIVEFMYKNKYHVGYIDVDTPHQIHIFQTTHRFFDILRDCFSNNRNLFKALYSFASKPFLLNTVDEPLIWLVPALPQELTSVQVFGFGYTHKSRTVNDNESVLPERFYKGNGSTLYAHTAPIIMPKNTHSISEEAEWVALYFIKKNGDPILIGYTLGNDLSDPILRRMDATQFAASKLRPSAIGAELRLAALPKVSKGKICITRHGQSVWKANYSTGTSQLLYSIEVITQLFVEMAAPIPGNLYYVFLGADKHSFADNFTLNSADTICINSDSFVFPLSNQVIMPITYAKVYS
jgi:hypothetical protein